VRLRGGACTRFQPKRRASIDHRPGPNIARAPPMVPSNRGTKWSPEIVMICEVSTKAINAPAMGVHNPGIRRSPDPARNADVIVVLIGGSCHNTTLACARRAEPPTSRMRSRPVPGQPPANVEYRRRNARPSSRYYYVSLWGQSETPKRVMNVTLYRLAGGCAHKGLQLDDSSLQANHRSVGSVIGPQFRKDVLDPALDRFFSNRKLISNLLVRTAGRD